MVVGMGLYPLDGAWGHTYVLSLGSPVYTK